METVRNYSEQPAYSPPPTISPPLLDMEIFEIFGIDNDGNPLSALETSLITNTTDDTVNNTNSFFSYSSFPTQTKKTLKYFLLLCFVHYTSTPDIQNLRIWKNIYADWVSGTPL